MIDVPRILADLCAPLFQLILLHRGAGGGVRFRAASAGENSLMSGFVEAADVEGVPDDAESPRSVRAQAASSPQSHAPLDWRELDDVGVDLDLDLDLFARLSISDEDGRREGRAGSGSGGSALLGEGGPRSTTVRRTLGRSEEDGGGLEGLELGGNAGGGVGVGVGVGVGTESERESAWGVESRALGGRGRQRTGESERSLQIPEATPPRMWSGMLSPPLGVESGLLATPRSSPPSRSSSTDRRERWVRLAGRMHQLLTHSSVGTSHHALELAMLGFLTQFRNLYAVDRAHMAREEARLEAEAARRDVSGEEAATPDPDEAGTGDVGGSPSVPLLGPSDSDPHSELHEWLQTEPEFRARRSRGAAAGLGAVAGSGAGLGSLVRSASEVPALQTCLGHLMTRLGTTRPADVMDVVVAKLLDNVRESRVHLGRRAHTMAGSADDSERAKEGAEMRLLTRSLEALHELSVTVTVLGPQASLVTASAEVRHGAAESRHRLSMAARSFSSTGSDLLQTRSVRALFRCPAADSIPALRIPSNMRLRSVLSAYVKRRRGRGKGRRSGEERIVIVRVTLPWSCSRCFVVQDSHATAVSQCAH